MTETEDRIPDDLAWSVIGHGSSTFHMIHGVAGSLQALLVVLPMSWLAAPPYREDRLVFEQDQRVRTTIDRKSTRLNSSHVSISYAVFCLKKKKKKNTTHSTVIDNITRT